MTKNEILELNKLIVEFMGSKLISAEEFNKLGESAYTGSNENIKWAIIEYLQYHSSWDWLMIVVEKIEMLDISLPETYKRGFLKNSTHGQIVFDCTYDNREEFKGWCSSVSIELSQPFIFDSSNYEMSKYTTKIEATFKAVVEFIKWYNQNK